MKQGLTGIGTGLMNELGENNLYSLNFGPQHPASHGVLRMIVHLSGERVKAVDPHIGFLHRGTEKLFEYKSIMQGLPYLDRLDYVSSMASEHAYSMAIEKMGRMEVHLENQYLRVSFLELTRLLNHLMSITTHSMDVGSLTPFLWSFEEREKLCEFYEKVSGARMHAAWIRPGGIGGSVPIDVLEQIKDFVSQFSSRLDELEDLLTTNRIWSQRTRYVGMLTMGEARGGGCSGPMLRSTGVKWDLRKVWPYEVYDSLWFGVPIGLNGDCFDRYVLRVYEMRESVRLIKQCLWALEGSEGSEVGKIKRVEFKENMEGLISHFKTFSNVWDGSMGASEEFVCSEAPKGEFGVFIVYSNESGRLYRVGFKIPGLSHLFMTDMMVTNHLLADLVTVIGTQDIVFGEVDR